MPIQNPQPWLRLTAAREKAQMSQKALADALGTDPVSVNRWEHGNTRPSWEYLKRIANILGVSIDFLLSNDEGDFFNEEETEAIIKATSILQKKVIQKK